MEAKLPVLAPPALSGHPLTRAHGRQGADDGDQVAAPFGLDLEHAEAVFLVEKGDALNQPGEAFNGARWWWGNHNCLHFGSPPGTATLGCSTGWGLQAFQTLVKVAPG